DGAGEAGRAGAAPGADERRRRDFCGAGAQRGVAGRRAGDERAGGAHGAAVSAARCAMSTAVWVVRAAEIPEAVKEKSAVGVSWSVSRNLKGLNSTDEIRVLVKEANPFDKPE